MSTHNETNEDKDIIIKAAYQVFKATLERTQGYRQDYIDSVVKTAIEVGQGQERPQHYIDTAIKFIDEHAKVVGVKFSGEEGLTLTDSGKKMLREMCQIPYNEGVNKPEGHVAIGKGPDRPKPRVTTLSELIKNGEMKTPLTGLERVYGKHKAPRPMEIEKTIYSKQDESFNIIFKNGAEARFVRRDSKFVIYVSSQAGCKQACRFCHLTQKGLTNEYCMTSEEIEAQAFTVYKHAVETLKPFDVSRIHINFMARGDAFLNDAVFEPKLYTGIETNFWMEGEDNWVGQVPIKYNVSTIMPDSVDIKERVRKLAQIRGDYRVDIRLYWSLYSMDGDFRRRWMPRAAAPSDVHRWINRALEHNYYMPIRTHLALIKDTNDGIEAIDGMVKFCYMIPCYEGTNIVAYNPFDDKSEETEQERIDEIMVQFLTQYSFYLDATKTLHPRQFNPIKQISRVGFDVQASCGLFHSE